MQPGFVEHVGRQSEGVRFDDDHWLAFAGLADAGVTLAGSSDEPCAPAAPLWCAALGASRTTSTGIRFEPEQAVALDSWLEAYTVGAARAGGQEGERGRIAPGLVADLVVLDRSGPAPQVSETWRGGECVFTAAPDGGAGEGGRPGSLNAGGIREGVRPAGRPGGRHVRQAGHVGQGRAGRDVGLLG